MFRAGSDTMPHRTVLQCSRYRHRAMARSVESSPFQGANDGRAGLVRGIRTSTVRPCSRCTAVSTNLDVVITSASPPRDASAFDNDDLGSAARDPEIVVVDERER